jgi:hypothetical protein
MNRLLFLSIPLVIAAACSAGEDGLGGTGNGTGGGGGQAFDLDSGGVRDPNDTRDLPVRKKSCDSAGNCTCLRLALLGTLDSAAEDKDTQPFTNWLNANSGGTATVTMVTTKPTLDQAFLSQYDILLVANVNGWTFSPAEKTAVETWVRETGGGIVSLTGFVSTGTEPAATSQLIEFSGIKYNGTTSAPSAGESQPVYYNGGAVNLKSCLDWTGPQEAFITTPIRFSPQTAQLEKLTFELDYVGAFIGFGVDAPANATVVATDPVSGQNMGVAREVDGTGRVFAFGDEWVIFANQWQPEGSPNNQTQDPYNICWVMPTATEAGFFHSVATLYQTKQFWYNAINWVAPPNECGFTIIDEEVHIY